MFNASSGMLVFWGGSAFVFGLWFLTSVSNCVALLERNEREFSSYHLDLVSSIQVCWCAGDVHDIGYGNRDYAISVLFVPLIVLSKDMKNWARAVGLVKSDWVIRGENTTLS